MRGASPVVVVLAGVLAVATLAADAQSHALTTATIEDIQSAFEAGTLSSEKLVALCLARIEAFDRVGPALNAVIAVNPRALERARALDEEREASGARSKLHGIPFVVKDNLDTAGLATTGGSFMLDGSIPPDDAFLVRRLREAGAIMLAKTNMTELASGDAFSSLHGYIRNPHEPERSASGSSGGTGAAIAAAFAPLGLGTDTGGSIRAPSAANGVVGLRPTYGLLSRDGIIPLGLSFDMAGPMARHVADLAVSLGVLAGVDPADAATGEAGAKAERDYTRFLDPKGLVGSRIGLARQFLGHDPDVDWVIEASVEAMRRAGATIVDIEFPEWLLVSRVDLYWSVRLPEFRPQIAEYLGDLAEDTPKSVDDLVERSRTFAAPSPEGFIPNASRWTLLQTEQAAEGVESPQYLAAKAHGLPMVRDIVAGILAFHRLDAIVYPTNPLRPTRLDADPPSGLEGASALNATIGTTPTNIASLAGFPDLVVPAGFTSRGLPVTISFLGPAFSEPRLLSLGFAFEQGTRARRLPVHTPPLDGESFDP